MLRSFLIHLCWLPCCSQLANIRDAMPAFRSCATATSTGQLDAYATSQTKMHGWCISLLRLSLLLHFSVPPLPHLACLWSSETSGLATSKSSILGDCAKIEAASAHRVFREVDLFAHVFYLPDARLLSFLGHFLLSIVVLGSHRCSHRHEVPGKLAFHVYESLLTAPRR